MHVHRLELIRIAMTMMRRHIALSRAADNTTVARFRRRAARLLLSLRRRTSISAVFRRAPFSVFGEAVLADEPFHRMRMHDDGHLPGACFRPMPVIATYLWP